MQLMPSRQCHRILGDRRVHRIAEMTSITRICIILCAIVITLGCSGVVIVLMLGQNGEEDGVGQTARELGDSITSDTDCLDVDLSSVDGLLLPQPQSIKASRNCSDESGKQHTNGVMNESSSVTDDMVTAFSHSIIVGGDDDIAPDNNYDTQNDETRNYDLLDNYGGEVYDTQNDTEFEYDESDITDYFGQIQFDLPVDVFDSNSTEDRSALLESASEESPIMARSTQRRREQGKRGRRRPQRPQGRRGPRRPFQHHHKPHPPLAPHPPQPPPHPHQHQHPPTPYPNRLPPPPGFRLTSPRPPAPPRAFHRQHEASLPPPFPSPEPPYKYPRDASSIQDIIKYFNNHQHQAQSELPHFSQMKPPVYINPPITPHLPSFYVTQNPGVQEVQVPVVVTQPPVQIFRVQLPSEDKVQPKKVVKHVMLDVYPMESEDQHGSASQNYGEVNGGGNRKVVLHLNFHSKNPHRESNLYFHRTGSNTHQASASQPESASLGGILDAIIGGQLQTDFEISHPGTRSRIQLEGPMVQSSGVDVTSARQLLDELIMSASESAVSKALVDAAATWPHLHQNRRDDIFHGMTPPPPPPFMPVPVVEARHEMLPTPLPMNDTTR